MALRDAGMGTSEALNVKFRMISVENMLKSWKLGNNIDTTGTGMELVLDLYISKGSGLRGRCIMDGRVSDKGYASGKSI
jgi:hypothetical protein